MNQSLRIQVPSTNMRSSNWLFEETKQTKWTPEENKKFEEALALFDKDTPDRWYNVAARIPGKTVNDVIKQYQELEEDVSDIEAGLVPIPGYDRNTFTLEWVDNRGLDGFCSPCGKRGLSDRGYDHERKKGVPWTEEEHRQFLLGLKKYGKGDWRNISRNFVLSRTPTQVASHAQKYFIRQLSGGKDKRRSSIHDITTVNITDKKSPTSENNATTTSQPSDQFSPASQLYSSVSSVTNGLYHWDPLNQGGTLSFNVENSILTSENTNPSEAALDVARNGYF